VATCRAAKRDGAARTLPATGPRGLCGAHGTRPRRARRTMAFGAATSMPSKELSVVKARLRGLALCPAGPDGGDFASRLPTEPVARNCMTAS
jgi:hypothetical protein